MNDRATDDIRTPLVTFHRAAFLLGFLLWLPIAARGQEGARVLLTIERDLQNFGRSVTSVGDLNDDGFPDLAVGAPEDSPPNPDFPAASIVLAGRVFVFSGNPADDGLVLHEWIGAANDHFGSGLDGGVDIDGDTVPDILVGASNDGNRLRGPGYAVIRSGASGDEIRRVSGVERTSLFGFSTAFLGDVNGDEVPDFIVGAPNNSGFTGTVRVYSGAGGDTPLYQIGRGQLFGTADIVQSRFGWSVAAIPDVNLDGSPDILVGAPFLSIRGSDGAVRTASVGGIFAFSGEDGTLLENLLSRGKLIGAKASDNLGFALASLGSVLVASAPGVGGGQGEALVFSGGTGRPGKIHGRKANDGNDGLGTALDVSQDVDGDTIEDVLVGISGDENGATTVPRVEVYSGGNGRLWMTTEGLSGLTLQEVSAVARTGDHSGDGIPDMLVGDNVGRRAHIIAIEQTAAPGKPPKPKPIKLATFLRRPPDDALGKAKGKIKILDKGTVQSLLLSISGLSPDQTYGVHVEDAVASDSFVQVGQIAGKKFSLDPASLPALGVSKVSDLQDRRVEIRDGSGTAVLVAVIPNVGDLLEKVKEQRTLTPPEGSPFAAASGALRVSFSGKKGASVFSLAAKKLPRDAVFSLWIADNPGSAVMVKVAELVKNKLVRSTSKGAPLPLDVSRVSELSGRRVEVRQDDTTVVLEGEVP